MKFVKDDFNLYIKKFDIEPFISKDSTLQDIINKTYKRLNKTYNFLDYTISPNKDFIILVYNKDRKLVYNVPVDLTQLFLFKKDVIYDKSAVALNTLEIFPEINNEYYMCGEIYQDVLKICICGYLKSLFKEFALFLKDQVNQE